MIKINTLFLKWKQKETLFKGPFSYCSFQEVYFQGIDVFLRLTQKATELSLG